MSVPRSSPRGPFTLSRWAVLGLLLQANTARLQPGSQREIHLYGHRHTSVALISRMASSNSGRRDDLLPQRVWALRKDGHEAAIDLKAVPGIGAEIVLTADGELRKTRLFRSHEQAELVGAMRTRGRCSRGEGR
jgi:hypothetical protein